MVTTAGKAPPGRILKTTNASNAQQEILATLSQRHLRKLRRNHELPDAITAEPKETKTSAPQRQKKRHQLEENPDAAEGEQGVKKRHRSCKYFCPECSTGNKRNYLCNVGRDTCFRVWHLEWNNGNDIPRELVRNHKMRDRAPIKPGKKRRRRQRLSGDQPSVGSDGIEEGGK
ncbi:hypothetical protein F441_05892 [Phytophthora nicotianae CJ01A1]|uniref:PiggyBac transposable element-derived protein 4 C-terminal zinc-ribbon domain-containing protein n=1 Tax=Phytophthora nicotianae CJ01A1 TaxID=1317063 RepID=W2XD05_PHYNI|nr:hypothetical protein F441_05892 [Phytophthora nicotianae CJ01A1]